jgi:hypothetical protein
MDCDGSLDPRELPRVAGPVASGAAELVLGARHPERGAWPVHARAGNRIIAAQLRRRTGAPLTDLGPMRCARRGALIELELRDRAFGWPIEMVLLAGRAGWRIHEVPVTYRARAEPSRDLAGPVGRAVVDDERRVARRHRGEHARDRLGLVQRWKDHVDHVQRRGG